MGRELTANVMDKHWDGLLLCWCLVVFLWPKTWITLLSILRLFLSLVKRWLIVLKPCSTKYNAGNDHSNLSTIVHSLGYQARFSQLTTINILEILTVLENSQFRIFHATYRISPPLPISVLSLPTMWCSPPTKQW